MAFLRPHPFATLGATLLATLLTAAGASPSASEPGIRFRDFARDPGSGLSYRRTPSPTWADHEAVLRQPVVRRAQLLEVPVNANGSPGVALFDFDRDGDLDLYVTNGPDTANSLFSNQLRETGRLTFRDVAAAAGVAAREQDSTGVCFGDTDNDGDDDLYVLGNAEPNRFFENRGNGTFRDISATSGTAGGGKNPAGCAFGDIDGDGLLDLAVANTYTDWRHGKGIDVEPYALNQHNDLFRNLGGNHFVEVGQAAGLHDLANMAGFAGLTWGIALVDYDLDGDIDIAWADDQGPIPTADRGGVDRGTIHLFQNDGKGRFSDVSEAARTNHPGGWMALNFGDLNCDGRLDFFASNFGDFTLQTRLAGNGPIGRLPSRWFLAQADGGFLKAPLGDLVTTPFGWGNALFDYDNDGDLDIIYYGGMDLILTIDASNGGVLLENRDCQAAFTRDTEALSTSTDHRRRGVYGLAVGDLDGDGDEDVVSVSSYDIPPEVPIQPVPNNPSPFTDAGYVQVLRRGETAGEFIPLLSTLERGTLAVELNEGGNRRPWASVEVVGLAGLAPGARANRSGIGAVVTLLPNGGKGVMQPISGGAGYASQDSLIAHFGLGNATEADVEVLWPGGGRNHFAGLKAGAHLRFPELPCPMAPGTSLGEHLGCILTALKLAEDRGLAPAADRVGFLAGESLAFLTTRKATPSSPQELARLFKTGPLKRLLTNSERRLLLAALSARAGGRAARAGLGDRDLDLPGTLQHPRQGG